MVNIVCRAVPLRRLLGYVGRFGELTLVTILFRALFVGCHLASTMAHSSRYTPSAASLHSSSPGPYATRNAALLEVVMKQVYGDWDSLLDKSPGYFPVPLPSGEAGGSQTLYPGKAGETQRRYLWTDAFGVVNFCTLYLRCNDADKRKYLQRAAFALVDAVQSTLGRPRSDEFPMAKTDDGSGRYKGMRIGKLDARRQSDAGMKFDGMYWHYVDKFIFALYKLSKTTGDPKPLADAVRLIKDVHPYFLYKIRNEPMGVRWKINSDCTPISGLEDSFPNDDALSGYVVYSLVAAATPGIENEVRDLEHVAGMYKQMGVRVSSDSLGWGLMAWKSQWLNGPWVEQLRDRLESVADQALDVRSGLALPFRLYGALLGAQVLGRPRVDEAAQKILGLVEDYEMSTGMASPHSAINKVMFGSAVDPLAFKRWDDEPTFSLS